MNKWLGVGNVGRDPEVRSTANGNTVANIRMATNSFRKNKDTGETEKETQWHNVVVWGPTAEYVGRSVAKGDTLAVEGEVRHRTYDDKDGNKRYVTEVWCQRLDKVGGSGNGSKEGEDLMRPELPADPPGAADDDIPF